MTKLLLVEDDPFLVKIYKLKLEREGYNIVYLEDGTKVVAKAVEYRPDLILLDIVIPKKDGFQVLSELKINSKTAKIPVLILSALQMPADIAKGKALGADDYLLKTNVSFAQVISTIRKLTA